MKRPTLCCKTNCNNCEFKINQIGCCEMAKEEEMNFELLQELVDRFTKESEKENDC